MPNIPVVVVAYKRRNAIKRLLTSLSKADYPNPVELIISIDKGEDEKIYDLARSFVWKFGEKTIIKKSRRLGLREHVLSCGDLTDKYEAVIILEDDLYVSPAYYRYVLEAVKYYREDDDIAGISLYSHAYNDTVRLPFMPLDDNADVFFLQRAASWGQCWTRKQWQDFKRWYAVNHSKNFKHSELPIPKNVVRWPETSWKKYFNVYLIDCNKYFVYPRLSLSTTFAEVGTHIIRGTNTWQVPLRLFQKNKYCFKSLNESVAVYDAFGEILPGRLNRLVPKIEKYDYTVDFYASKALDKINTPYLLSTRSVTSPRLKFARKLKPVELNLIAGISENEEIFLAESVRFQDEHPHKLETLTRNIMYYCNVHAQSFHEYNDYMKDRMVLWKLIRRVSHVIRRIFGMFGRVPDE